MLPCTTTVLWMEATLSTVAGYTAALTAAYCTVAMAVWCGLLGNTQEPGRH